MLSGVATFTYVMRNFITMLKTQQTLDKDISQAGDLDKFFGTLTWLNNDNPVNPKMKAEFEEYFDYLWKNNKNWAVVQEEDLALFDQLPLECA